MPIFGTSQPFSPPALLEGAALRGAVQWKRRGHAPLTYLYGEVHVGAVVRIFMVEYMVVVRTAWRATGDTVSMNHGLFALRVFEDGISPAGDGPRD